MRVFSIDDLGFFIRDYRLSKGISQAMLAGEAGVSRRWLTALEAGKSTVEIGLVLKTVEALGLGMHVIADSADAIGGRDA